MDNLQMSVLKNYYDTLKKDGYVIIHGVDKYDCYKLKRSIWYIFELMCEEGYHNVSAIDIAKYGWYLQVLFTNILMIK